MVASVFVDCNESLAKTTGLKYKLLQTAPSDSSGYSRISKSNPGNLLNSEAIAAVKVYFDRLYAIKKILRTPTLLAAILHLNTSTKFES